MAVNTSGNALPEGFQLGEFIVRGVVGLGGFGVVYRAWDAQLERDVAIKEYLPCTLAQRNEVGQVEVLAAKHQELFDAGMRSFINEAKLLAQFDHPALVKVYRFWEAHGTAYMVMPLYNGVPLKSWWNGVPPAAREAELRRVVTVLCDALGTLHLQQCFHRDIAPDNILILQETEQPVLLDFGAARRLIGSSTQAFTVVLKASYAPIEQYAEDPTLQQGPWTDVYALGAVMYDLMKGKPPPSSITRMIQDTYEPLIEQIGLYSEALCTCVNHCLQRLPTQRLQSMRALLSELERASNRSGAWFEPTRILPAPSVKPTANKPTRLSRTGSLRWLLAISVALTTTLAVVLAGGLNSTTHRAKQVTRPQAVHERSAGPPSADALLSEAWTVVEQSGAFQPLEVVTQRPVLKIGTDLLSSQFTAPLSGWLSVYTFTTEGRFVRLIPNNRVAALPVTKGKPMVFPPPSEPIQSAGPPGINRLWFVVSPQPPQQDDLRWMDDHGYGWLALEPFRHPIDGGLLLGQALLRSLGCTKKPCQPGGALGTLRIEEVQ